MLRIFVINLERSADRRETMRTQLDAMGLDYEFFPAVDGGAGEHLKFANYSDRLCLEAWRRPLVPGEVGAFASHYLLWQRCKERGEPIIVMEDDIEVSPRFADASRLLPSLASLGYVRLAGTSVRGLRAMRVDLPADWKLVRFLTGPAGTLCYALFPQGASGFLAGAGKWTLPVDNYMDSFWEHGVACLGLMPFPISIGKSPVSTISGDGPSPSALMRDRVWRPKRFLARKIADFRCHLTNLKYAAGLRKLEGLSDVRS
jgi:glycosyl transferase family 25